MPWAGGQPLVAQASAGFSLQRDFFSPAPRPACFHQAAMRGFPAPQPYGKCRTAALCSTGVARRRSGLALPIATDRLTGARVLANASTLHAMQASKYGSVGDRAGAAGESRGRDTGVRGSTGRTRAATSWTAGGPRVIVHPGIGQVGTAGPSGLPRECQIAMPRPKMVAPRLD